LRQDGDCMQIHDQGGEPRALILEGRLDSESAAAL
jgi:hypothetical protein